LIVLRVERARRGYKPDGPSWCIQWDEDSELELAQAAIGPWEVEEAFLNGAFFALSKLRADHAKMVGVTNEGRYVTVILQLNRVARLLRPLTGWNSTPEERNQHNG